MPPGPESKSRSPLELVELLQARISTAARSYRLATVRYLMRPPLSLRPKYVAFLLDLAHQSDHMQEVLGRAAERVSERAAESPVVVLLRNHHREERNRMQLVMGDLRRLGYAEELPQRVTTSGDAALRAYSTTLSYERPTAMLGILLVFLGVAAEISPIVVRLLSVGSVPKEAMGWLLMRQTADPQAVRDLLSQVAELVTEPTDQASVLEAAEVTGELLALGAAARPAMA